MTCPQHPRYQAKRAPQGRRACVRKGQYIRRQWPCPTCLGLWYGVRHGLVRAPAVFVTLGFEKHASLWYVQVNSSNILETTNRLDAERVYHVLERALGKEHHAVFTS